MSTQNIRLLLNRINAAWLSGNFDDLAQLLDPEIVIRGPNLEHLARGRDAAINSYKDFTRQAKVHSFKEGEPEVDLNGNIAVAICPWQISYEMNGQTYDETGRDLFVLAFTEGNWRAVWRAVLSSPAAQK
jgi:hypothetical protein